MALVASAGCFPTPDPPWLVDDRPELLALRLEVASEGEYSAIVAAPPADRRRTEALPGDTITMRPWVTDATRVWPEDELDVAYFACFGVACIDALRNASASDGCTDLVDLQAPACFIGRGALVDFVIPSGPLEALSTGVPEILAVAGLPGVTTTDACVEALRQNPTGDVHDCMLLERFVAVGPRWVLGLLQQAAFDAAATDGGSTDGGDTDSDDGYLPPPEVYLEWPNFNPEVERFSVAVRRQGSIRTIDAAPSDRIHVRVGDEVEIDFAPDPRDDQRYATELAEDGSVNRIAESGFADWFVNHRLDAFTNEPLGTTRVQWQVPRDVAELRIDLRVNDGRGGVGWGSLFFEVDGTPR